MDKNPDVIFLATDINRGDTLFQMYAAEFANPTVLVQMNSRMASVRLANLVAGLDLSFPYEGTMPPERSGEPYASFAAEYWRDIGRNPPGDGETSTYYDAVFLVALAMEAGRAATGSVIGAHLAEVTGPGGTAYDHRSFAAAVAAIRAGAQIDWVGASGELNLTPAGEPASADYCIWKIQGGRIVCAEPSVHIE
jgi:ABC-type branched-subunit amino acid transport system substrate-binding protein